MALEIRPKIGCKAICHRAGQSQGTFGIEIANEAVKSEYISALLGSISQCAAFGVGDSTLLNISNFHGSVM